jgi:hypothetical protein
MDETVSINLQRKIWEKYERMAKNNQESPIQLMEKVLITYLNNEETEEGVACNINFFGSGSIDPC